MNFNELNVDLKIINNLTKIGFQKPTQIQELVIQLASKNKNILGCAQTGTGKTAAFGVSLINKILDEKAIVKTKKEKLNSLIIVPTRELAIQVNDNIKSFSENLDIKSIAIYGGMRNKNSHFNLLKKGVDIVVATPGRLLDYLRNNEINLSYVKTLIIDEADLMVDMGFIDDVKMILEATKKDKQIMLFSATMPKQIMNLVEKFMGKFELVATKSFNKPLENIKHVAYYYTQSKPIDLLKSFIENEKIFMAIIFVKTKRDADNLERTLSKMKLNAESLHGDKTQAKRTRIIDRFKKGKIQYLVATDVASRGIDVDDVTHIFNLNIPEDPEIYTHRVGRTGRAKKEGKAVSFFGKKDFHFLSKIEKEIKMDIPKKKIDLYKNKIQLENFDENINVKKERKSHSKSTRSKDDKFKKDNKNFNSKFSKNTKYNKFEKNKDKKSTYNFKDKPKKNNFEKRDKFKFNKRTTNK